MLLLALQANEQFGEYVSLNASKISHVMVTPWFFNAYHAAIFTYYMTVKGTTVLFRITGAGQSLHLIMTCV